MPTKPVFTANGTQPRSWRPRPAPLALKGLTKHFPIKGGLFGSTVATVRAVDGVSFDVMKGETLGIVGESGCGKSTTARLLVLLLGLDAGTMVFDGEAVGEPRASGLSLREYRRQVQMVFQDSHASLNPACRSKTASPSPPGCMG